MKTQGGKKEDNNGEPSAGSMEEDAEKQATSNVPSQANADPQVAIAQAESNLYHQKRTLFHEGTTNNTSTTSVEGQLVGALATSFHQKKLESEGVNGRSSQELLTPDDAVAEPPSELVRNDNNANSAVGAFSVPGIGRTPTPSRIDLPEEELSSANVDPSQPELLVEAKLVGDRSSSFFHTSRRLTPVLGRAEPLNENASLSWTEISTSPKVLGVLCTLIVIIAITAGVAIGVTKAKDDASNNEDRPTAAPSTIIPHDDTLPQPTLAAIQEPGSPQSRANEWMLQDENRGNYSLFRQRQRFGLVAFYYATDGENWIDSMNWLNYSIPECDWGMRAVMEEGRELEDDLIIEEDFNVWEGDTLPDFFAQEQQLLACTTDQIYTELIMVPNNLAGSLPAELFLFLPELQVLDIAWNPLLVGSIPSEVGLLSQLIFLSASENGFTGALPSQIGGAQTLAFLDLYHNLLSSTVPTGKSK